MLSAVDKKLIQILKIFVQKSLLPQIKKSQGSTSQWNKFCVMLANDNVNINQLQIYVDNLPWIGSNPKKLDNDNLIQGKMFDNGKCFGNAKNNHFQLTQNDMGESKGNQNLKPRANISNNYIVGNLEKLLKCLEENQSVIDGIGKELGIQGRGQRTAFTSNGSSPTPPPPNYPSPYINQNVQTQPSIPMHPYSQGNIAGFYQKISY